MRRLRDQLLEMAQYLDAGRTPSSALTQAINGVLGGLEGTEQLIRPGQLNLMTAGHGIAHAEETPAANAGRLRGVQLWVALPEASRGTAPAFALQPVGTPPC